MFFAHGSNHSCGVMTLIRKDLDFEDESCLCDPAGRFIILNATVQGVKYIFLPIFMHQIKCVISAHILKIYRRGWMV